MANLREPGAAGNRELLTGARWFAGKHRAISRTAVAGAISPPGAEGASVDLVDVEYEEGETERYALALRDGAPCGGDDPLWPALAQLAGVAARTASGFLAEDLSNTVVLLDGRHVLKLYRRLEPGPHPEVELLSALRGTPHAPPPRGAFEHEGATLVSTQGFVPGEAVGWERLVAALAAGDRATGLPAELAEVTALLHALLAERLGAREGVQRIHGDLHVGQFLRRDDGRLVVLDWEGDPTLPLAERRRPRPALRDLASLRLSLAHAARAAARRRPGLDWRSWSRAARREALEAYAAATGPVDAALLHELEVEKEHAELAYAERWLPEWLYVPRDVLPFVLEGA